MRQYLPNRLFSKELETADYKNIADRQLVRMIRPTARVVNKMTNSSKNQGVQSVEAAGGEVSSLRGIRWAFRRT